MNIQKKFLTVSSWNRPGTALGRVRAVACHYIGNPGTSAMANRNYFENLRITHTTKASCHYIIGLNGEILQLIPEDEVSWCTNQANGYTISIEACHPGSNGKFTDATYNSYVELAADICSRHGLDPLNGGVIRHYDVTGKVCPKWFVDHPDAWEQFKRDVAENMKGGGDMNQWIEENGRWWYKHADGSYTRDGWELIHGQWYLFDADGWMLTGWQQRNGVWYYLCGRGCMEIGWQNLNGAWYFMDESGAMRTGWIQDGGEWYYLNDDGKLATGWKQVNGQWYHLGFSGAMDTGLFQDTDGKLYYLAADGHMCRTDASGALM